MGLGITSAILGLLFLALLLGSFVLDVLLGLGLGVVSIWAFTVTVGVVSFWAFFFWSISFLNVFILQEHEGRFPLLLDLLIRWDANATALQARLQLCFTLGRHPTHSNILAR